MKRKAIPPTYFWLMLVLMIGTHLLFPIKMMITPPFTYFGMIFIFFGILSNIWTDILFKKSRTTVKPHEIPSTLLKSGPFRISRHPMYLGMTAILLGAAFLSGALSSFIFPVFFALAMELLFIPVEERNLEKVFGDEYGQYKRTVRRWV
jgi:protein-S-isoprenylcysteine O-methyltransferase Ste14